MGERALNYLALTQVPAAGMTAVREGRASDRAIRAARRELDSLGTEEASDISRMLAEDPLAANRYVMTLYGGWDKMYAGVAARSAAQKSARMTRTALAASPPVTPAEAARRDIYLGNLELGQDTSPATLNSLAPPRVLSPASLGLQADDWTGESLNATMQSYRETGKPDYTLLNPAPLKPGEVPKTTKIPSGWYLDDKRQLRPIPGTRAEMDYTYSAILKEAAKEVSEPGNNVTDFNSFLKAHPDIAAWVIGYWKKSDDPMTGMLARAFEQAFATQGTGAGAGAAAPSGGGPGLSPEAQKTLETILKK